MSVSVTVTVPASVIGVACLGILAHVPPELPPAVSALLVGTHAGNADRGNDACERRLDALAAARSRHASRRLCRTAETGEIARNRPDLAARIGRTVGVVQQEAAGNG